MDYKLSIQFTSGCIVQYTRVSKEGCDKIIEWLGSEDDMLYKMCTPLMKDETYLVKDKIEAISIKENEEE